MGSDARFSFILFSFLFITLASVSSVLSDGIFGAETLPGRTLLQAKKACKVDFEKQNYTILTSQCKGPQYPAKVCCKALKQFACPFVDDINDMTTDCSSVMFSYINVYGKYPPGLFANQCKDDKNGLDCQSSDVAPQPSSANRAPLPLSSLSFILLLLPLPLLLH